MLKFKDGVFDSENISYEIEIYKLTVSFEDGEFYLNIWKIERFGTGVNYNYLLRTEISEYKYKRMISEGIELEVRS